MGTEEEEKKKEEKRKKGKSRSFTTHLWEKKKTLEMWKETEEKEKERDRKRDITTTRGLQDAQDV